MFVREKKNTTGTISVQVIDKSRGRYKVIKTIGSSADKNRVADYVTQGKQYIVKHTKQVSFDFQLGEDIHFYNTVYDNIESMQLLGPELILGKLFNEIGFDQIKDELFRHLVIARMIYPVSKLKTLDYLLKYKGIVYEKDQVYRYLDKLHREQIQLTKQISYTHTVKLLKADISIVVYDVTTLYFESERKAIYVKQDFQKMVSISNRKLF